MNVSIRAYQPKDRTDVRRLFQETAFHGRSFKNFIDDGEWLADVMTASYTDAEPAHSLVAEGPEGVIGYLTGTLDSAAHSRLWRKHILGRVIKGFFSGGTWKSMRAWKFFWHGFISSLRGQESKPRDLLVRFPAHLHVNIDERYRDQHVGALLVQAFLAHMKKNGILAVHLRTSSKEPQHRFFKSQGFRPLHSRILTLWTYLGEPPYHLIAYGQHLKP